MAAARRLRQLHTVVVGRRFTIRVSIEKEFRKCLNNSKFLYIHRNVFKKNVCAIIIVHRLDKRNSTWQRWDYKNGRKQRHGHNCLSLGRLEHSNGIRWLFDAYSLHKVNTWFLSLSHTYTSTLIVANLIFFFIKSILHIRFKQSTIG